LRIAALALLAASQRGQRILNIADPMALTVAEIAAAIVSRFDYSGDVLALPDEALYPPSVGRTPGPSSGRLCWTSPRRRR